MTIRKIKILADRKRDYDKGYENLLVSVLLTLKRTLKTFTRHVLHERSHALASSALSGGEKQFSS